MFQGIGETYNTLAANRLRTLNSKFQFPSLSLNTVSLLQSACNAIALFIGLSKMVEVQISWHPKKYWKNHRLYFLAFKIIRSHPSGSSRFNELKRGRGER